MAGIRPGGRGGCGGPPVRGTEGGLRGCVGPQLPVPSSPGLACPAQQPLFMISVPQVWPRVPYRKCFLSEGYRSALGLTALRLSLAPAPTPLGGNQAEVNTRHPLSCCRHLPVPGFSLFPLPQLGGLGYTSPGLDPRPAPLTGPPPRTHHGTFPCYRWGHARTAASSGVLDR